MPLKHLKSQRMFCILWLFLIAQTPVFARADLVVVNADIRTIDSRKPRAEALAVTKNTISAIGTNREIRALIDAETIVVDAGGKLLLPGFNDAHVHFMSMGSQFFSVDLRNAKTAREIIEKIKFHARFVPPGAWILGSGWNNENWTPRTLPTKNLIDEAAPEHPVFLYHANARTALVNSRALRLAGIGKISGAGAENGEVARDNEGAPDGILRGAVMNRVRRLAPRFAADDKASIAETASRYAAAFGVTSVQDMSADDHVEIYRALAAAGKLKTRIYDCTGLENWRKNAPRETEKSVDALVRTGCLKGSVESADDASRELFEEIRSADRAGRQIMIHAIGAQAGARILSIFERAARTNGARERRFRVEHAHALSAPDLRRFARTGIIASVQPFLFSDESGRSFDALRDLVDAKAPLAMGSDASMIPVNPLSGIAAAVSTSDPRQRLSVEEAVRAYTLGSAYAEFRENAKGTLAAGKLADFVILSDDIFTIDPGEISRTKILTTVMDGKIVYRAE